MDGTSKEGISRRGASPVHNAGTTPIDGTAIVLKGLVLAAAATTISAVNMDMGCNGRSGEARNVPEAPRHVLEVVTDSSFSRLAASPARTGVATYCGLIAATGRPTVSVRAVVNGPGRVPQNG